MSMAKAVLVVSTNASRAIMRVMEISPSAT
jgi:hypothetical protein